ncbi:MULTISPECIES: CE1759 family FMN reductase [unclassified Leucobacter]|uniref:CE1759 family FMN reductase n=1 Tax=unclassified Leucobacter TaxID=2621730 RepID=UPI00165D5230|nr:MULTISPECIES: CE1759 family FMN reductase [unclassified Leucobacter]MBC9937253.1 NAD(P)H-dependent oxidoreductase [Leucobacter sp. cx-87]
MTIQLVAVSGGLGTPSSTRMLADRVLGPASRALEAQGGTVEVTVIELRELAVQIANNLLTGYAEPALAEALAAVRRADGIVAVTPVFNGSMAGLFKSFWDLVEPDAIRGVPVALGATGGTARHSLVTEMAMRPLFAYLRAFPLPTGMFVETDAWGSRAGAEVIDERAGTLGRELADAVRLLRGGIAAQDPAVSGAGDARAQALDTAPAIAPSVDEVAATAAAQEKNANESEFAALMSRFAGAEVG